LHHGVAPNVNVNFNARGGTFTNYRNQFGSITVQIPRSRTIQAHWGYTTTDLNNHSRFTPTRSGYVFEGWYISSTNAQLSAGSSFAVNTLLHARWHPVGNTSTITFDPNGGHWLDTGVGLRSRIVRQGRSLDNNGIQSFEAINMVPVRSGFRFDGWEVATTGALFTLLTNVQGANTTVRARWTPHFGANIAFNPQGGIWADGSTTNLVTDVALGHTVSSYANTTLYNFAGVPTRAGYSFNGWVNNATNTPFTADTTVNENITVSAQWINAAQGEAAAAPIASPFVDVPADSWYFDYIIPFVIEGVFYSIEQDRFEPHTPMSRAMLAHLLLNMSGDAPSDTQTFNDVTPGSWYFGSANWAVANGLMNGTSANAFNPDDDLTVEQLATALLQFARYHNISDNLPTDSLEFAFSNNLIAQRSGGESVTRTDVAVAFARLLS